MGQTELAQRRLLEALASLERTSAGGIGGMRLAFPAAIALADGAGIPKLADVWRRIDDLATAVQADLKGTTHA